MEIGVCEVGVEIGAREVGDLFARATQPAKQVMRMEPRVKRFAQPWDHDQENCEPANAGDRTQRHTPRESVARSASSQSTRTLIPGLRERGSQSKESPSPRMRATERNGTAANVGRSPCQLSLNSDVHSRLPRKWITLE